jgi:methylthioribose-1-phosphate isomerase
MPDLKPLEWRDNKLILLDQRLLPRKEVYLEISDYRDVVEAIRTLAVRGAPALGVAAAYGVALGALSIQTKNFSDFLEQLKEVAQALAASRPTARNLFWALEGMLKLALKSQDVGSAKRSLVEAAIMIHAQQMESDQSLARFGANLFKEGDTILTHCNAGALATAGFGTALGVIKQAHANFKNIQAIATETRPLLQGARLTAFELKQAGIPFTLITDSMAGSFMRRGKVQGVIVGADRIAANGDTANKIGTYCLAVLAKENGIPFYVAAPLNTVDVSIAGGEEIIIEERQPEEVTSLQGVGIAPQGVEAANPAFDVTPHQYISAIITERGIVRKPFRQGLKKISSQKNLMEVFNGAG